MPKNWEENFLISKYVLQRNLELNFVTHIQQTSIKNTKYVSHKQLKNRYPHDLTLMPTANSFRYQLTNQVTTSSSCYILTYKVNYKTSTHSYS